LQLDFLRRGENSDNRFLKGRKKVAGAEREINSVGDSGNEGRRTFFKKPGW